MPHTASQTYLRDLDENRAERDRLPKRAARRVRASARINRWTAADRLRSVLDAAALAIRSDDTPVVRTPQVVSTATDKRVALPGQHFTHTAIAELSGQLFESAKLESAIRANLKSLNFKP